MLRGLMIGLLVLAFGGIGVVAFVALSPTPPPAVATQEAVAPPAPRAAVLTAAVGLRAGALLKAEEISATIPPLASSDDAPAAADSLADTPATRAAIVGGLIRRSLAPGAPILSGDVMRPGEHGFLAAVLQPGTRAIAVGVDAVTGAAGLIWPGDRVDVILTQTLDDATTPAARRIAGETVLTGVRVIAVDQHLVQGGMETISAGTGIVASARTVTVEVSARDAERLSVAARLGRLSLTVRSALLQSARGEAPDAVAEPVTWGGDVSNALRGGDTRPSAAALPLRVFNGPARSEEVRF